MVCHCTMAKMHVIVNVNPFGYPWTRRWSTQTCRVLTDIEHWYSQIEKERVEVVWGCERFHYIYRSVTSEVMYSPTFKPPAHIEWWVCPQPFQFSVIYSTNAAHSLSSLTQSKIKVKEVTENYENYKLDKYHQVFDNKYTGALSELLHRTFNCWGNHPEKSHNRHTRINEATDFEAYTWNSPGHWLNKTLMREKRWWPWRRTLRNLYVCVMYTKVCPNVNLHSYKSWHTWQNQSEWP